MICRHENQQHECPECYKMLTPEYDNTKPSHGSGCAYYAASPPFQACTCGLDLLLTRVTELEAERDSYFEEGKKAVAELAALKRDKRNSMTEKIFKFEMGEKVKGIFAGDPFIGEIITRSQSHTAGNSYAIYGDKEFRSGERREWFCERELESVTTQPALGL